MKASHLALVLLVLKITSAMPLGFTQGLSGGDQQNKLDSTVIIATDEEIGSPWISISRENTGSGTETPSAFFLAYDTAHLQNIWESASLYYDIDFFDSINELEEAMDANTCWVGVLGSADARLQEWLFGMAEKGKNIYFIRGNEVWVSSKKTGTMRYQIADSWDVQSDFLNILRQHECKTSRAEPFPPPVAYEDFAPLGFSQEPEERTFRLVGLRDYEDDVAGLEAVFNELAERGYALQGVLDGGIVIFRRN